MLADDARVMSAGRQRGAVSGLAPALLLGRCGIGGGGSEQCGRLPPTPRYGGKTTIPWVLSIGIKGCMILLWAVQSAGYDLTANDDWDMAEGYDMGPAQLNNKFKCFAGYFLWLGLRV